MTSQQIADLTGKSHLNVIRDIKTQAAYLRGATSKKEANNLIKDESFVIHELKHYTNKIEFDNRGYISLIELDEELTLTLTSGYSVVQRHAIVKQWKLMREAIEATRYRLTHTAAQLEAMTAIHDHLPIEEQKKPLNYIVANTVVNKVVSTLYGYPKMIEKPHMNKLMLVDRDTIMADYVKLFELGFDNHRVKQLLHEKYLTKQVAA